MAFWTYKQDFKLPTYQHTNPTHHLNLLPLYDYMTAQDKEMENKQNSFPLQENL